MGVCRKKCEDLDKAMSMRFAGESGTRRDTCEELGLESL